MPTAATIAFASSALPGLEPLAGLSLAVNVAYLNLKRWRYRVEVQEIANNALRELNDKQNDNGSSIAALSQLKGLKALADQPSNRKKLPGFIQVFHVLFGMEWDVRLSVFFSVFSAIVLCAGVAHDIKTWEFILPISKPYIVHYYFHTLLLSLLMPTGFVLTGRYLVKRSTEYVEDCFGELASVYEDKIDLVQAPVKGA